MIIQIQRLRRSGSITFILRKYLYDQIPRYDVKVNYKLGREELVIKVLAKYTEQRGKARQACRLEFVEILSNKDSYGRTFFTVKVDSLSQNLSDIDDNIILAPGEKNVRLLTRHYVRYSLTLRKRYLTSTMLTYRSGVTLMFSLHCCMVRKTMSRQKLSSRLLWYDEVNSSQPISLIHWPLMPKL